MDLAIQPRLKHICALVFLAMSAATIPLATAAPASAIYRGTDANIAEFPWMVSIQRVGPDNNWDHTCGGTLIARDWVLTAAHCVLNESNDGVAAGSALRVVIGQEQKTGTRHAVGDPVVHREADGRPSLFVPQDPTEFRWNYDVALLPLVTPVSAQHPVLSMAASDPAVGTMTTIVGWGSTGADPYPDKTPTSSNKLQKLDDYEVAPDTNCFAVAAAESMLCGTHSDSWWDPRTAPGVRKGDSGGPMLLYANGSWSQIGIVSNFVGDGKTYEAFTSVAYWKQWIDSMTNSPAPAPAGAITTALIIDSSGSMSSNDPNDDRKDAAKAYLTVSPNDDAGVVDFDDTARVLAPAESVSGHRAALESAIDQIDSDGGTDLGAGLQAGCDLLGKATTDKRAAIFFTDGEGSYNDESSCYAKKGWRVYTIGLGDSVDESLLKQIAADTHGRYFHLDAGSNPVCEFQQIRAEIAGVNAADCKSTGTINLGQTIAFIQKVISGLKQFTFTNTWSGSDIKMTLTSPSGKTYDRDTTGDPGVVISRGRAYESFTILDPEPGDWHVSLYGADIPDGGEAYTFSTVALPKDDTMPPAPPVPPTTTTPPSPSAVEVQRIAGKDRYATAAALSAQSYRPGVQRVFIASGEAFADALGGGAAAAAADGPMLLVKGSSIPDAVADELRRLAPKSIVVLGGSHAVTDAVLNALKAYTDGSVERWAGDDRYGTAVATAEGAFPTGAGTAYVASGLDFPDGLAGTPGAAKSGGPLLLTRPDTLPVETAAELQKLGVTNIVVLGGPNAVSDAVFQALESYGTVSRIFGSDRYGTAAALTQASFPTPVDTVVLTTGTTFPDALSGGAFAGSGPVPLLITQPQALPDSVIAELSRLHPAHVIILGGTNAVSEAVAEALSSMN